jgi:hypothetical protein
VHVEIFIVLVFISKHLLSCLTCIEHCNNDNKYRYWWYSNASIFLYLLFSIENASIPEKRVFSIISTSVLTCMVISKNWLFHRIFFLLHQTWLTVLTRKTAECSLMMMMMLRRWRRWSSNVLLAAQVKH